MSIRTRKNGAKVERGDEEEITSLANVLH